MDSAAFLPPPPPPSSASAIGRPAAATGAARWRVGSAAASAFEKSGVSPKKLNALLVKAGRPPRDEAKWARAIEGSYLLVHAKLLATGDLVAFARATSDQALNGTVWDVVVDPSLPDVPLMRRNVVKYLLNELRRSVPGCSVTLFAQPDDVDFYTGLEFVADAEDVHGMALIEDPDVGFHS
ncbi:hypothetical protein I4F81_003493 [Pyropia yezoensis]|uniref:Uncharacterized protein n=1 Tax=Pyropia yezoensis TaxID=2788 RepID=A0ACC3BTS3_PYRYE|nr:hypothetical protein I4F81_003493 [Neopyropia yezoensis]